MTKSILLFLGACSITAAADPSIVVLDLIPDRNFFDIVFKPDLINAEGQTVTADCKVTTPANLQSGASVIPQATLRRVRINLLSPLVVGTKIEVLCTTVDYFDAAKMKHTAKNLKGSGTVPSGVDYQKSVLDSITKAAAAAKKQNEQDIFASGFVTTASSGSAGGADISLNPDLKIPHLKSFLQIKKTTQDGGDAKHFEGGAKYQVFFLADRKAFQAIQNMGGRPLDEIIRTMQANESKSGYGRAFIGSSLDIAGKIEGTPGGFEVTNLVGDSSFTLRSKTAGFLNHQAFFKGFITPAGFEGGQSHANQDAATAMGKSATGIKPDWIARYKTGLAFRLHYEDAKGTGLFKRVELSGDGVVRNIFLNEAMWDSKAKAITRTGKGVRAYGQLDLKVYLGESDKGRYGLKLSYNRGSLPPVFARVKSFQFGFLWESKDNQ
ncbi:MAG: hypothetical protein M3Z23_18710 [Acidobacteriota bacterium]|nr:hypothetical protein [Acidobacteriota bacterium]